MTRRLILGLGNPGPRFIGTRHNVGFAFVERLAAALSVSLAKPLFGSYRAGVNRGESQTLVLCMPLTYMNRSGSVIRPLRRRFAFDEICPVVDNMDLPPGEIRMKTRGSASTHNGIRSIEEALGTRDFPRIYIGVGRTDGDVIEHVLGPPSPREKVAIDDAVDRLVSAFLSPEERSLAQLASSVNALRYAETVSDGNV